MHNTSYIGELICPTKTGLKISVGSAAAAGKNGAGPAGRVLMNPASLPADVLKIINTCSNKFLLNLFEFIRFLEKFKFTQISALDNTWENIRSAEYAY